MRDVRQAFRNCWPLIASFAFGSALTITWPNLNYEVLLQQHAVDALELVD